MLETLSERGVVIEVLNMGTIDNTPTGKLIRNIMSSFSKFEHDMIVQRTQEGKAIARQNADFRTGISVMTIYRAKLERTNRKHLRS